MANKIVKRFLAVLVIGGFLLSYQDGYAENEKGKVSPDVKTAEKGEKVPDVVATINGVKISGVEFSKGLQSYKKRLAMMGQEVPLEHAKEINKTIIDDLVSRELLIQNCNKVGIKVSDDELNKEMASIKSRYQNEEQFNQEIKSQNLTMDDVKNDVRKALAIKKLIKNDIEDKVSVDKKAVEVSKKLSEYLADLKEKADIKIVEFWDDDEKEEQTALSYEEEKRLKEKFSFSNLTVLDKEKKLVWTRDANMTRKKINYDDALKFIESLNEQKYGGYNDWRLPSKEELLTLVNFAKEQGYTEKINDFFNKIGFKNVQTYGYWSSTTYALDTGWAWFVRMDYELVSIDLKTNVSCVLPVRAGK